MKYFSNFLFFSFLFFSFFTFSPTFATDEVVSSLKNDSVIVYVFAREDCRHCQDAKDFLTSLESQQPFIQARYLDIHTEPYALWWKEIARLESFPLATPIIIVGNTAFSGFDSAKTTGKLIESLALENRERGTLSPEEIIQRGGTQEGQLTNAFCQDSQEGVCELPTFSTTSKPLPVSFPFLGPIDVSAYSLPLLSLTLGFIDGFNPCALWVLVTFLLILAQTRSRKRMFFLAGLFILSQGIIYTLILNIWFTTWNFIDLDTIVTPIVGIIAILGGAFFLYEWSQSKGTCSITTSSKREKIIRQIKKIASSPLNPAVIFAILFLALSISIIEFACSIGIPQAFTKILEMNSLSFLGQQSMMLLYILAYMIDDLIVFGIAIWSMEKIGITAKYSVWTNLIGGILMLVLGFLLLFSPDTLRFI